MENAIIIYLLKVSVSIAVFYLLFKALFRKDTFYQLKRSYFLFGVVFSLIFPFYTMELSSAELEQLPVFVHNISLAVSDFPAVVELVDGSADVETHTLSLSNISLIILAAGIIGFFVRFLIQLLSLMCLAKGNDVEKHGNYYYVNFKNESSQAFSFFQWIFIPSDKKYDNADIQAVIQHEMTHVRQMHSVDVVLFELMCILFWWNPFMWLMRREVRANLEYLADKGVLDNGYDAKKYQYSLLNVVLERNNIRMVNNFNFSELKNRIMMMNRKKTSALVSAKYLLIVPFASVLLLGNALSASTNPTELLTEIVPTQLSEIVPMIQPEVADLQQKKDTTKKVYDVVEGEPSYVGGEKARLKFLNENLAYPAEAKTKKIEGTVTVGFVVSETGEIENIRILRGKNKLLDDEALRVTKLMPKWIPGTQNGKKVSVNYTMRIVFRLSKEEAKEKAKSVDESEGKNL